MTLATYLTVLRILLVLPLIGVFFIAPQQAGIYALAIFIIASLTDFLDGFLARQLNQVTDLGRFLDPIADKLLVAATLMMLIYTQTLDTPLTIFCAYLIIAREIFISGLREYSSPYNIVIHVTFLAKAKTTVQMLALIALLASLAVQQEILFTFGQYSLVLAAGLTLITAADYFVKTLKQMKKIK